MRLRTETLAMCAERQAFAVFHGRRDICGAGPKVEGAVVEPRIGQVRALGRVRNVRYRNNVGSVTSTPRSEEQFDFKLTV